MSIRTGLDSTISARRARPAPLAHAWGATLLLGLAACGGGGGGGGSPAVFPVVAPQPAPVASTPVSPASYSIAGTVSGLAGGAAVTLLNNGGDALAVSANGSFGFATPVVANGSYAITIGTQPAGQTCSLAGGTSSGSGVTANIDNVRIVCSTQSFSIGGKVAGLANGQQATLLNNGGDALAVKADGSFSFATPVAYKGSYSITVGTQPAGQTCSLAAGTGTGSDVTAAVDSIRIVCSTHTYKIGGTVTGLVNGKQVTLLDNGGDALTVTADGSFAFATPIAYNGSYAVTVGTQPVGLECSVSGGSGSGVSADVANVGVSCANAGVVSTLAGKLVPGAADGTGTAASFNDPFRTAVDGSGNVYVADYSNRKIRKITPAGVVSTLAGSGAAGNADGPGATATFNDPIGIAVDSAGNVYVADTSNHAVRKITPAGFVSTLAGNAVPGLADGTGAAARFRGPSGLALDGSDNLYVADAQNNAIRKITPAGVVTTLAGGGSSGRADGTGAAATFYYPMGLAFDGSGNLYIADRDNSLIRKLTPAGVVTTLAGGTSAGAANGTGAAASFRTPFDVTSDSSGNAYVADGDNHLIRRITPAGVVTTYAGSGQPGHADGIGSAASFNRPAGISIDGNGVLYVAELNNNLIRKIAP
ncbi:MULTISPECIES: hypothetical protein [unclassified Variovorax]|uniref:hypothetical protein n=1 Tax=unclassified Variovorax TaxID=663243 RepID=UPI003F489705